MFFLQERGFRIPDCRNAVFGKIVQTRKRVSYLGNQLFRTSGREFFGEGIARNIPCKTDSGGDDGRLHKLRFAHQSFPPRFPSAELTSLSSCKYFLA